MGIMLWEITDTYRKWWAGKMCRLAGQKYHKFKKVKDVQYYSNKVYGAAEFIFEDGTTRTISTFSYQPRKKDVEVKDTGDNK